MMSSKSCVVASCFPCVFVLLALAGCSGPAGRDSGEVFSTDAATGEDDTSTAGATTDPGGTDTQTTDTSDEGDPLMDMGPPPDMGPMPPDEPPMPLAPCENGSCWSTLTFSAICGSTFVDENYASGSFNVHEFSLSVWADRPVELSLTRTGGAFFPAIVIHDDMGETVYDGEIGAWNDQLTINAITTGEDGEVAAVEILPKVDMQLSVFLTGWDVIASDFVAPIPTDVTYTFEVYNDCVSETGTQLPPNFDPNDIVDGYHLLPPSEPPGLYTRKADGCSRGIQRLIEVIYTVAVRWAELRPEFTPITVLDLNEGPCSTVDHETHDDGTHVDLTISCATEVACANWVPAVDLARLFVDTGEVCGIIFNDDGVQAVINPYFEANHDYEPWHQTFMRTVAGHESHFHLRVKKLDETCN
jgi:hypothetical protein